MNKPLLVADLFCGAGGSSAGAERAVKCLGKQMILTCVNHWPVAIETHRRNHPTARHYLEDVSVAKPRELVPEGYLDLLMASPECTHFSRARGGKPVNDQSRMNPWAVIRWLTDLDVRCLLVENVPEFVNWGPLGGDSKPIDGKKGLYFEAWIRTLWELGYHAEWRCLTAADFGDVTTRERFFLIARKDDKPITWPEPTHRKNGNRRLNGELPIWRGTCEILERNKKGRSLLDDPKYKKRPLSINTRKRIARGLEKYGGEFATLYIKLLGLDTDRDGGSGIPESFVMGKQSSPAYRDTSEPIPTITTEGKISLIEPTLMPFVLGQQSCGAARTVKSPLPTITGGGYISLIEPQLVIFHKTSENKPIDEPMPSLQTKAHIGLVEPLIISYYGNSYKDTDVRTIDEPLATVTTKERFGLVEPIIVQIDQSGGGDGMSWPISNPLQTIVTKQSMGFAEPILKEGTGDIDPRRLVIVDGIPYILDILFRMLNNKELALATGFDDAETEYEFVGTATEVTKQIGNAVPVNMAAALVKVIFEANK